MAFLQRGRTPVLQMQAPPGADMGNSASKVLGVPAGLTGDTVADFGAKLQGRISLGALALLTVGAVAFYLWTRDSQAS